MFYIWNKSEIKTNCESTYDPQEHAESESPNNMKKLTINAPIATTIAFLGVLLIATGALGIVGMAESNLAQRNAYEVNFSSVVALGRSGTAMSRARFALDWAMSN